MLKSSMLYLIKTFMEKEHATDFVGNGRLLFRHINYFRKIEDENVRGDTLEGSQMNTIKVKNLPSTIKSLKIKGKDGKGKEFFVDVDALKKEFPQMFDSGEIEFKLSYIVDCMVYCMSLIDTSKNGFENILAEHKKFGTVSVVVWQPNELIRRVREKTNCECAKVKYIELAPDNKIDDCFTKHSRYSLQSEYRFLIDAQTQQQRFVEIGNIEKIAFCVVTEELPEIIEKFDAFIKKKLA